MLDLLLTSHLRRAALAIAMSGMLTSTAAAAAGAEKYKIQFSSPDHVGDTFSVSGIVVTAGRNSRRFAGNQSDFQNINSLVALDGAVTVLEVNKNGDASKFTCTVDFATSDGKPLCEKGKIIIAEQKGSSEVITIDGKPADPDVGGALSSILTTGNEGDKETMDTIAGTTEPQPVGGIWSVKREAIARSIARHGMTADKQNISGGQKLVAVKQIAGRKYLQVDSESHVSFSGTLAGGAQLDRRTITEHGSSLIPADGSGGPIRREDAETMTSTIHAQTSDNQPMTVEQFIRRDTMIKRSDVKISGEARSVGK